MIRNPQLASRGSPGRSIGLVGLVLGIIALASPMLPTRLAFLALGLLILIFGVLQNYFGFALRDSQTSGSWFSRGGGSILTGLLLIATPRLTFAGLAILLGMSWAISGVSGIVAAFRRNVQSDRIWRAVDGVINVALGLAIAAQWPISGVSSIGIFVALRYLSAGWSLVAGSPHTPSPTTDAVDRHPDERLGLPAHPYVGKLRAQLASEELVRARSDRGWCWLFLLTFFVIHACRMDTDWNLIGLLSPAGAVAGDVAVAILLAYGLVAPIMMSWRSIMRPLERKAWNQTLGLVDQGHQPGYAGRIIDRWLIRRMRAALRQNLARGSVTAGLGWGLRVGLPAAAILMAMVPLWGVSWFFNTESWVTGGWEMWADQRTDTWRVAMVDAARQAYGEALDSADFCRMAPEGLDGGKDFSFVVIGDTGEGDASQLCLHEQLLLVGLKPEVKFLVVSSDVIYPAGAMKDYEPKFYLPFKGFHKPIYAVPGNHDWYDALESFTANFYEPKAARAAMRARREVDHGLTTTTEARTENMIHEAERLRGEYQLQVARQRTPYFEIGTEQFSLVVVDTGILRRVDDDQMRWLDAALQRGAGRYKMAILGHPLYVASRYQGDDDPDFAKIHQTLKKHGVNVVMAGDTHDFEYYKVDEADGRTMYHFVNGGGGAYLSVGTALDRPKQPLVPECGCYPRPDALMNSLEKFTPAWKRPIWWWFKHLNAWPSTREMVGSAFDYNHAPFFQSFMEVRVENSANTVRFWLYGVNGRLRWRDIYVEAGRIPHGKLPDDFVEFAFPLRGEKP